MGRRARQMRREARAKAAAAVHGSAALLDALFRIHGRPPADEVEATPEQASGTDAVANGAATYLGGAHAG